MWLLCGVASAMERCSHLSSSVFIYIHFVVFMHTMGMAANVLKYLTKDHIAKSDSCEQLWAVGRIKLSRWHTWGRRTHLEPGQGEFLPVPCTHALGALLEVHVDIHKW